MTYDEAVRTVLTVNGPVDENFARAVLDAIGFRQMQERLENLAYLDEAYDRLEALHAKLLDTAERLERERDAARTLADRAAPYVALATQDGFEPEGRAAWLADWEARGWK